MRRSRAHGAPGLQCLDQENGTYPRMGVITLEPGPYRQHLQAGEFPSPFTAPKLRPSGLTLATDHHRCFLFLGSVWVANSQGSLNLDLQISGDS